MVLPFPRNKILPLRGLKSALDANLAEILDGEFCYATDEDQYYQNEDGVLVPVGATKAQGSLADSATQPGDNISTLTNDAAYVDAAGAAAAAPVQSVAGKTGAVTLVKADVGLGSVDNTSDADKPVSTAQQTALNAKVDLAGGVMTGDLLLGNQSDLRFGEATGNGTNWVAFQGPANIAANVTWTLPATDATIAGYALVSDTLGNLSWARAGGAAGGGADSIFYENDQTVSADYTITSGKNAMSAGPVMIGSGITVTVPSGSVWTVV